MTTTPFFLFKTSTIEPLDYQHEGTTLTVDLNQEWIKELSTWEQLSPDADWLRSFPQIILPFPKFTDGRSYSIALLLKKQLQFQGTLLAGGEIALDQIPYLYEIGFDGFEVPQSNRDQNLHSIQSIVDRFNYRPQAYQRTHL